MGVVDWDCSIRHATPAAISNPDRTPRNAEISIYSSDSQGDTGGFSASLDANDLADGSGHVEPESPRRCKDTGGAHHRASTAYSCDLGALFLRYDLANCAPDVALPIIYEYLDRSYTGGPGFWDPQRVVVEDARWWAQVAPPHERAAYGMAALELLPGGYLGLNIRKKIFLLLWESFPAEDQLGFLQHIYPEGFRL